jgi:hypothetical protein
MDLKKIEKMQNIIDEQSFSKEIDNLLEKDKSKNKNESDVWNKLDRSIKLQLLHAFAERYGKLNNYSIKEIKSMKIFFIDCLDKGKLSKVKEVNYNKEKKEVESIPGLFLNPTTKNFTLKNMDENRVSTLKSLTPKKTASQYNATANAGI